MDLCPNCGAPLPLAQPGEIERCTFCEAETRARGERAARVQQAQRPPLWDLHLDAEPESEPPKAKPTFLFAMLGGVAFVVAAVGIGLAMESSKHHGSSTSGGSSYSSPASPTSATPSHPRVLTPAALATVQVDQWLSLTSTPFDAQIAVGDLSAFDVVGNFDWAESIGADWSSDAKLYRVYVSGMAPDGTINVATGTSDVILDLNSVRKGDLDFSIEIHRPRGLPAGAPGANMSVNISSHRDSTARIPLSKPICPMSKAIAVLRASSGLANANPQYGLAMGLSIHGGKEYWFADYATGDAKVQGAEDFVDAVTCAIAHLK